MPELAEKLFSALEAVTSPESPLAGRACVRTLYALIRNDQMPGVVRIGRRVYLTGAGMREFIANGGAR